MSREEYNELNRKAFDSANLPRFEHPDFRALSKLSVLKYLSLDPAKGTQQRSEIEEYSLDRVQTTDITADQVNESIWIKQPKVLDFASGAGNVSLDLDQQIPESAKPLQITGIDISPSVVQSYNTRVPDSVGSAYAADIMDDACNWYEDGFDVAICTLSLHHIPDLQLAADKIFERLKPGGWLLVMDFDGQGIGSLAEATRRGVAHTSLSANQLVGVFEKAGFATVTTEVGFRYVFAERTNRSFMHGTIINGHRVFPLCIVAGQKPGGRATVPEDGGDEGPAAEEDLPF